jgi:hypothetical protein
VQYGGLVHICKDLTFLAKTTFSLYTKWRPCPTCRESSHYPDPIPETALAETVLTENTLTDIAYQSRYTGVLFKETVCRLGLIESNINKDFFYLAKLYNVMCICSVYKQRHISSIKRKAVMRILNIFYVYLPFYLYMYITAYIFSICLARKRNEKVFRSAR